MGLLLLWPLPRDKPALVLPLSYVIVAVKKNACVDKSAFPVPSAWKHIKLIIDQESNGGGGGGGGSTSFHLSTELMMP